MAAAPRSRAVLGACPAVAVAIPSQIRVLGRPGMARAARGPVTDMVELETVRDRSDEMLVVETVQVHAAPRISSDGGIPMAVVTAIEEPAARFVRGQMGEQAINGRSPDEEPAAARE